MCEIGFKAITNIHVYLLLKRRKKNWKRNFVHYSICLKKKLIDVSKHDWLLLKMQLRHRLEQIMVVVTALIMHHCSRWLTQLDDLNRWLSFTDFIFFHSITCRCVSGEAWLFTIFFVVFNANRPWQILFTLSLFHYFNTIYVE